MSDAVKTDLMRQVDPKRAAIVPPITPPDSVIQFFELTKPQILTQVEDTNVKRFGDAILRAGADVEERILQEAVGGEVPFSLERFVATFSCIRDVAITEGVLEELKEQLSDKVDAQSGSNLPALVKSKAYFIHAAFRHGAHREPLYQRARDIRQKQEAFVREGPTERERRLGELEQDQQSFANEIVIWEKEQVANRLEKAQADVSTRRQELEKEVDTRRRTHEEATIMPKDEAIDSLVRIRQAKQTATTAEQERTDQLSLDALQGEELAAAKDAFDAGTSHGRKSIAEEIALVDTQIPDLEQTRTNNTPETEKDRVLVALATLKEERAEEIRKEKKRLAGLSDHKLVEDATVEAKRAFDRETEQGGEELQKKLVTIDEEINGLEQELGGVEPVTAERRGKIEERLKRLQGDPDDAEKRQALREQIEVYSEDKVGDVAWKRALDQKISPSKPDDKVKFQAVLGEVHQEFEQKRNELQQELNALPFSERELMQQQLNEFEKQRQKEWKQQEAELEGQSGEVLRQTILDRFTQQTVQEYAKRESELQRTLDASPDPTPRQKIDEQLRELRGDPQVAEQRTVLQSNLAEASDSGRLEEVIAGKVSAITDKGIIPPGISFSQWQEQVRQDVTQEATEAVRQEITRLEAKLGLLPQPSMREAVVMRLESFDRKRADEWKAEQVRIGKISEEELRSLALQRFTALLDKQYEAEEKQHQIVIDSSQDLTPRQKLEGEIAALQQELSALHVDEDAIRLEVSEETKKRKEEKKTEFEKKREEIMTQPVDEREHLQTELNARLDEVWADVTLSEGVGKGVDKTVIDYVEVKLAGEMTETVERVLQSPPVGVQADYSRVPYNLLVRGICNELAAMVNEFFRYQPLANLYNELTQPLSQRTANLTDAELAFATWEMADMAPTVKDHIAAINSLVTIANEKAKSLSDDERREIVAQELNVYTSRNADRQKANYLFAHIAGEV